MMSEQLATEIKEWLEPSCSCGREGTHAVCSKCGVHADLDVMEIDPTGGMVWNYGRSRMGTLKDCEACGAKSQNPNPYNYCGRSVYVPTVTRLSEWEIGFLRECLIPRKRISPKMMAIIDRCRIKVSIVETTAKRDAIDCCPKRGKTFKAVLKAIGYSPLSAAPRRETGVTREDMAEVRRNFREMVYERTGWDKLPDVETYSDALKAVGHKTDKTLCNALYLIFEYHVFMVRTGRFVEGKCT